MQACCRKQLYQREAKHCGITCNKPSCKQGVTNTAANRVFQNKNYGSYHKTAKSFEAVTLEKGLDIKVRESVFNATLYQKGNCCLYKQALKQQLESLNDFCLHLLGSIVIDIETLCTSQKEF